ncbi:unnamed protein product [Rhizoctonia solani]|uniref:Uncharacterized protein n=1 Tax=Rhizoctonia solani TaxID=456999 RepID=A0A8H3CWL2_9AGAM|nr:uncharacterized protein RhiXN_11051 [Rhizoctonia solani]QRW25974.1 hypothetical protein RhiXN_11051 [Rhizoctonia solani]CAE6498880.1 unnamed protein product [Rhizoctonia solani]CAE6519692.1 unnamed protein product [Rhizoctonia solani]
MSTIKDGVYALELPFEQGSMTDTGDGRWISILQPGSLGPDAHKVKVVYNKDKGAYTLQFEKSELYITFEGKPMINNKLTPGDKPRYFQIKPHQYEEDKYIIIVAEDKKFHIGLAMERIFPPWVAMNDFPEKQAWLFRKV